MIGKKLALAGLGWTAAFLVALAPLAVQAEEEAAPSDDIVYEVSDPEGSPPVNFRSDYDESYDTQENHDAEMYAEDYERRQREEKARQQEQLDKINEFTGGGNLGGINPGSNRY